VPLPYDAVLLVSFGGPEKLEDVRPFLENVVRGKNVPGERLLEVAEHYALFGGQSPVNAQNRALLTALIAELNTHGPQLPVYWGNRHWHPFLSDALRQMAADGIRRALAFVTSAFGCYSSCRQYLEEIERARQEVGSDAPEVDKLRLFYNHPGFIEPVAQRVSEALAEIPEERRSRTPVLYSAHSLPMAMARKCAYVDQLLEACRLVSECVGCAEWELVYQSRSGPPSEPWLEPDVCDRVRKLAAAGGIRDLVIVPLGFLAENVEILYDLEVEARSVCDELGLNMVRSAVVGCHWRFVRMIRELIVERVEPNPTRLALGSHGPSHDVCPADCCPPR